ncbi:helix-turn-helix domain-containing protein [Nicoliella spurrieriana]|uniref:Helix-turn-helix domain-containing protein n=1 Tax=Nicoliella spurrieriana TaxID=2925830 RepID=A0A976X5Y1_9LACO|nr:helix-turn-helix transcriptional regulator [Nicoliella spurrieriana]UQS87149.1 helix-turn-helix domain-containing protein [Nicoliella spurrieriana]
MPFGANIKQLRRQHSLTQAQLGQQLNVSRKTISSWENQRSYPDIPMLLKISSDYDIDLNDLLRQNSDIVNNYQKQGELMKRNQLINQISYGLNICLLLLYYFNLVNSWHVRVPFITLLLVVNMIVWNTTKSDVQPLTHNKKLVVIASGLFLIFQCNLTLALDGYDLSRILASSMTTYRMGEILGNLLAVVTMIILALFSFLIMVFGYAGPKHVISH